MPFYVKWRLKAMCDLDLWATDPVLRPDTLSQWDTHLYKVISKSIHKWQNYGLDTKFGWMEYKKKLFGIHKNWRDLLLYLLILNKNFIDKCPCYQCIRCSFFQLKAMLSWCLKLRNHHQNQFTNRCLWPLIYPDIFFNLEITVISNTANVNVNSIIFW